MRVKYSRHTSKQDCLQIPYSEDGIRDYITLRLKKYVGKTYYNKSLGVNISVSADSIEETAQNCRPNRQAAALALHLPYILRNAKIVKLKLPTESKKQKNRFHFSEIAHLVCYVPGVGIAKVIIGFRIDGRIFEYAITNFQRQNKTSQFEF